MDGGWYDELPHLIMHRSFGSIANKISFLKQDNNIAQSSVGALASSNAAEVAFG